MSLIASECIKLRHTDSDISIHRLMC